MPTLSSSYAMLIHPQVVNGTLCINPGTLSKRRGAGTFAAMNIQPRRITDDDREAGIMDHRVYERARVDVTRI